MPRGIGYAEKKMKKQGSSDRTNEKQGMEIKGIKDKMKKRKPQKGAKRGSSWIDHVKKVAKQKGIKYGEALKVASKTYKK